MDWLDWLIAVLAFAWIATAIWWIIAAGQLLNEIHKARNP